jgi:hypothetical protein
LRALSKAKAATIKAAKAAIGQIHDKSI